MSVSPKTILLVEDNDEDAFLLKRAFRLERYTCELQVAQDGQEAIDYLSGAGKYADRAQYPLPALMLLDLKLPYVNGFEVLAWMADRPEWKGLRVIILTSSGEERDRDRAAGFGIESYFVKPPTPELVATVAKFLPAAAEAVPAP